MLSIHTIGRRRFYAYHEAMQALGLSTHPNQLQKRIQAYPNEIITLHAQSYISIAYAKALEQRIIADEVLLAIKDKGGAL